MPVSPPRPKGPHLNALRAFEAAARRRSFTGAAEELSVTPGAVTQHVKALEAWAGARLFTRSARGVAPTPLAEALLPRFSRAFDELGEAVQALRAGAAPNKVRLATLPAIAQLWLAPRLGALRRAAPAFSVSVIALESPPNLTREPFDLSLFFSARPAGPHDLEILRDRIFPVCAPATAARLKRPADLSGETLLHDSAWSGDWAQWLAAHGGGAAVSGPGTAHSLFAVALEEARHGGGVLMAHEALVTPFLENGDLVKPFPQSLDLPRRLVARMTPAFAATGAAAALRQALLS